MTKPLNPLHENHKNDPGVNGYFAKEYIKWTFNLEKAPWWGGVFGRHVRSVKRYLRKSINGASLAYEDVLTVIICIYQEKMLKSLLRSHTFCWKQTYESTGQSRNPRL